MAKIGYWVSKTEVLSIVRDVLGKAETEGYLIENNKKFEDNLPSSTLLYAFLKRQRYFCKNYRKYRICERSFQRNEEWIRD